MTHTDLNTNLLQILQVLALAEQLKRELRHSWLSNGRRESVAEHSWRLGLMVILLAPALAEPVDLEKCLKMALIHDLAEAETGDQVAFQVTTSTQREQKFEREQQAMRHIQAILGTPLGDELFGLWMEFETQQSYEARFIRALDKLEVQLQHNEANMSTWLHREKLMIFQPQWLEQHCQFDPALRTLSQLIKDEAIQKLMKHGEKPDKLRDEALRSPA